MSAAIVTESLQRCAEMDLSSTRGWRFDADRCEKSDDEVIRKRAEGLRLRAENLEAMAEQYLGAIAITRSFTLPELEAKVREWHQSRAVTNDDGEIHPQSAVELSKLLTFVRSLFVETPTRASTRIDCSKKC